MLKISQFSLEKVAFTHRFFLTHCDLIRKFGTLRKKTRSDTTWNSRIAKIFPGSAGISIGKTTFRLGKTLWQHLFAEPYLPDLSSDSRKSGTLRKKVSLAFQRHQYCRKLTSEVSSTVHVKTDKNKEKRAENLTRFSPRQPPSCADSFQLTTSWFVSLEL